MCEMLIELSIVLSIPPQKFEASRTMLLAVRRGRFSKTAVSPARPHVGHRETGRRPYRGGARSIVRWIDADDVSKRPAEGAQAHEADVEAYIGDGTFCLAQQEHRPLDTPALEVSVRRLAEGGSEGPDEVRLRHVRHRRQRGNVKRLGVGAVDRIAGAQ